MKKPLRILLKTAIALLLLVILTVAGLLYMLRGVPKWYRADTLSPEQRQAAARSAEDKYIRMTNWAAAARASYYREPKTSQATTALEHAPAQPFQIDFSDDELNAFFDKWQEAGNRRELIARYVENPRLVLHDQQLILVGNVREMNTIVSMQFEPAIDSTGNLQMSLQRVLGGILPLPDAMWARQRGRLQHTLERALPAYQKEAKISADGSANGSMASACMNLLLQSVLQNEPSDAVMFIPIAPHTLTPCVPVKITAINISNSKLTMIAEQMTQGEREALLKKVKSAEPAEPSS